MTYVRVFDICFHIQQTYGVGYTVSGFTKWLHEHGFRYKKPKVVPAKVDLNKQKNFICAYRRITRQASDNEVVLFMDSMHPTMNTKLHYGWIRKGTDKPIAKSASNTRINITGAIEIKKMKVISHCSTSVNAQSTVDFFDKVAKAFPRALKIHIFLDLSGYHRSAFVKMQAKIKRIKLHYLPPYQQNWNVIKHAIHEQIKQLMLHPT